MKTWFSFCARLVALIGSAADEKVEVTEMISEMILLKIDSSAS